MGDSMQTIVRLLGALALLFGTATVVHASAEASISALRGRQATEWRRTTIDLTLVSSYYDDPANPPIWVKSGKPTPAAAELLESLTRADEDGLDPDDYLTRALLETTTLRNDDDAAGYELAMSQAFLNFARD